MRRLDELHLDYPFAGARMLRIAAATRGHTALAGVASPLLMKRMGIQALYRRPNTSKPALGHKIYPYLLRGVTIDRPNHVWAMDMTYIPMSRGFCYLSRSSTGSPAGARCPLTRAMPCPPSEEDAQAS